jgi:hypothetical protein
MFEETLAHEMATVVKEHVQRELAPLKRRIQELETDTIALRAQIKALAYQDAPSRPTKSIPFGPAPRLGRSKEAH